jgi:hypothetical protein
MREGSPPRVRDLDAHDLDLAPAGVRRLRRHRCEATPYKISERVDREAMHVDKDRFGNAAQPGIGEHDERAAVVGGQFGSRHHCYREN